MVTLAENLTISPCSIDLSRGETQFIAEAGREYLLQTCLQKTDLRPPTTVILDCPPSLGVLSLTCLMAADYACVVVQPGGFEIRTLIHLQETIRMLKERVNPKLSVIGAVLTNCHLRRTITEEVCREVSRHWPVLGQVRADARLLYATTSGKVHYLTRSNALQDYAVVVKNLWRFYRGFKDNRRDQWCFGRANFRPTDTGCTNERRTIASRRQKDAHCGRSKYASCAIAPSFSAWTSSWKKRTTRRSEREGYASYNV